MSYKALYLQVLSTVVLEVSPPLVLGADEYPSFLEEETTPRGMEVDEHDGAGDTSDTGMEVDENDTTGIDRSGGSLKTGAKVILYGLKARSDLNDAEGSVVGWDEATQRHSVELTIDEDGTPVKKRKKGSTLMVKCENLLEITSEMIELRRLQSEDSRAGRVPRLGIEEEYFGGVHPMRHADKWDTVKRRKVLERLTSSVRGRSCDTVIWLGLEFENARCVRDALMERMGPIPEDFMARLAMLPDSKLPRIIGGVDNTANSHIPSSFDCPSLMPRTINHLMGRAHRCFIDHEGNSTRWPSSPYEAHVRALPPPAPFEEDAVVSWHTLGESIHGDMAARFQAESDAVKRTLRDIYASLQGAEHIPALLWVVGSLTRQPNPRFPPTLFHEVPLPDGIRETLHWRARDKEDIKEKRMNLFRFEHIDERGGIAKNLGPKDRCRDNYHKTHIGGTLRVDANVLNIMSLNLADFQSGNSREITDKARCHAAAALIPQLQNLNEEQSTYLVYAYFYTTGPRDIDGSKFKEGVDSISIGRIGRPICIVDWGAISTEAEEREIMSCSTNGDWEHAFDIFERIHARGGRVSTECYYSLRELLSVAQHSSDKIPNFGSEGYKEWATSGHGQAILQKLQRVMIHIQQGTPAAEIDVLALDIPDNIVNAMVGLASDERVHSSIRLSALLRLVEVARERPNPCRRIVESKLDKCIRRYADLFSICQGNYSLADNFLNPCDVPRVIDLVLQLRADSCAGAIRRLHEVGAFFHINTKVSRYFKGYADILRKLQGGKKAQKSDVRNTKSDN